MNADAKPFLEFAGHCPICEAAATYRAAGPWLRDTLVCGGCGSVPRERALALMLAERRPNWRQLAIHECSPAERGVSHKLRTQAPGYVATHFFENQKLGSMVRGFRNENLEAQTFADQSFDLVVTLDVFEHLFDPAAAHREIWRTLKPGGLHICTFPISKHRPDATYWRARRKEDGSVEHIEKPEYHGNPISGDGALVTVDYGYDVHRQIAEWAPFAVSITRTHNARAGVLGEFTEVVVCERLG